MNIKFNYCCKKFRRYAEEESYDFSFSVKMGKFHWGELEYDNYEEGKPSELTYYIEYCPFCGRQII